MAEPSEVEEAFGVVVQALSEAKVDAAFIGAIAVIAWSRVRTTTDVDLVVGAAPSELARLRPCLERRGFSVGAPVTSDPGETVPDISVFWSGHRPSVRVDVFHAKTEFEREALRLAVPAEVGGQHIRVATPEAVIVYKVLSERRSSCDGSFVELARGGVEAKGARLCGNSGDHRDDHGPQLGPGCFGVGGGGRGRGVRVRVVEARQRQPLRVGLGFQSQVVFGGDQEGVSAIRGRVF